MSTTPPDQPTQPTQPSAPPPPPPPAAPVESPARTQITVNDFARLPIPGNAEFLLYFLLEVIFSMLWWFRDDITTLYWMVFTTVLTFAYFISRGIAKASRVLEQ